MKILFLSPLLLLISCSSVRVKTDYDKEYDFSNLKTYAKAHTEFEDSENTQKTITSKRIKRFAVDELASNGFTSAPKNQADFLLDYRFTSEDVIVPAAIQPSVAFGYGPRRYYGGGVGVGYNYGAYQREQIDTLIIEAWDAKTKEHIWTAKAEGTLIENSADKTEKNFQKAIQKIFSKFPPDGSKKQ